MDKYLLELVFPADENMWVNDSKITKVLGLCDGSGYGFGERDMAYYFKNIKDLNRAVKKLKALDCGGKVRATIQEI